MYIEASVGEGLSTFESKVVWILSAFSKCLHVSGHRLRGKFVVVLKKKLM